MRLLQRADRRAVVAAPNFHKLGRRRRVVRSAIEPLETRVLFAVGVTPSTVQLSTFGITVTYNASTDLLTLSGPASNPINLTVSSPASNTVQLVLGATSPVINYFTTPDYPAGSPPAGSFTISSGTDGEDTLTILTDSGHAPVSLFDLGLGNTTDALNFSLAGTSTGVGNVAITTQTAGDLTTLGSINITGTLSDTGGAIAVPSGSTITTNGGDIDLTGTGNGPNSVGVEVTSSTLNAGSGNITLIGTGGGAGDGIGVEGDSSSTITGSGTVTITGTGAAGSGSDPGVSVQGTITGGGAVTIAGTAGTGGDSSGVILGSVTSTGGAVTISGVATNGDGAEISGTVSGSGAVSITGTAAGTSGGEIGVSAGSVISTSSSVTISGSGNSAGEGGDLGVTLSGTVSGSGAVTITGTGGGGGENDGVSVSGAISTGGAVTITGTGGGGGTSAGVAVAAVTSTGSSVTITGTSTGITAGGDPGVSVSGAISGSGAVTITGTSAGAEGGSDGVDVTSVTSTGAGVTINGAAGGGAGVVASGAVSGKGAVSITGTGAGPQDGGENGVSLASVVSTGASVTISGSGGSTGEGSDPGVTISGSVSGGGAVTITGTGGGGDGGEGGVSAGAVTGGGAVIITGTGGAGSSSQGVSVASVTSTGGSVTISGSGGATGTGADSGVNISGTVSGSGAVTITGTGGAGGGGDPGVSSGNISAGGAVTITGTGGAGGGSAGVALSSVTSTGAGVTISGTGTGTDGGDHGVTVSGTVSGSGAVAITGTAGSQGGSGGADGVDLASVTSTTAGVTITGISGTGNGVDITGAVSGSGAVTITGTGGGASSGEAGVFINGGSVAATAGGAVTITGSWSSAVTGDYGVGLNGASITTGIPATNPIITGTATHDGQNGVFIGNNGATMNLTLVSAPVDGSVITVVHDVGARMNSTFSNIADGQVLTESYGGKTYKLTAHYSAGANGMDLVLAVAAPPTGSLAGSSGGTASSYNLTQLGTSDWAHWGTGQNASTFDDKASGGGQISNVSRTGPGSYGAYTDSSRDVIWSDGMPLAKDNGDQSYIWANNATGAGYTFTAPADTTTRTLYVYLGGYDSGGTLTATLSDSSATPYTTSFSGSAIYNDIVAITYKAGSASQHLLISYTKTAGVGVASGSVDLDAAWIGQPLTNLSPVIGLNPKSQTVTTGTDVTFTASASTIGTAPPTVQWYMSTNGGASFTLIPGQTNTTLDIGPATLAESGNEYEAIFTTSAGTAITSPATLTVNPAPASSGSLVGSSSTAGASYNYTTLGNTDWIHWGRASNVNNVDRKAMGGSQISNVTRTSAGSYGAYADPSRDSIWSDGMPTAKDTGDTAYIWANNAAGAGYTFTAPADTTTRTLYIYLGGYDSGGTFTATLSDNSANPYTVSFSGSSIYTKLVAITYKAGAAGQKLNLSYTKTANVGVIGGSVDLIGAWLA